MFYYQVDVIFWASSHIFTVIPDIMGLLVPPILRMYAKLVVLPLETGCKSLQTFYDRQKF